MDFDRICMGCMKKLPEGMHVCPACGFDPVKYEKERNPGTLPLQIILNGKYMLGRGIGQGGFGITYLAWNLTLDMAVAIKEYFPAGLSFRDTTIYKGRQGLSLQITGGAAQEQYRHGLASLEKEAKTLARFNNLPGVVHVMDFFMENQTAYLVMEYVDGLNLKIYCREYGHKFTEREVLDIMDPVIRSMGVVHKNDVIHCDISPDNILRKRDGQIVLVDFGAARAVLGSSDKSHTILLKRGYAPPEQYQTKGKQGPWTDIYALCATMYNLLTDHVPDEAMDRMMEGEDNSSQKIRRALLQNGVSQNIATILQKGLRLSPADRYQTMEELHAALYGRATGMERPQTEPPVSEKTKGNKPAQKKVNWTWMVAAAAIVFGLGGVAYVKLHLQLTNTSKSINRLVKNDEKTQAEKQTTYASEPDMKEHTEAPTERTAQSETEELTERTVQSETEEPTERTVQSETEEPTERTVQSETEEPTERTAQSEIEIQTEKFTAEYIIADYMGGHDTSVTMVGTFYCNDEICWLVLDRPGSVYAEDSRGESVYEERVEVVGIDGNGIENAEQYYGLRLEVSGSMLFTRAGILKINPAAVHVLDGAAVVSAGEDAIHEYKVVMEDCTWEEAFEHCIAMGGYLVRINTEEEYQAIVQQLNREGYTKQSNHLYIAARRETDSREYYWINENNAKIGDELTNAASWTTNVWYSVAAKNISEPSYEDPYTGNVEDCINMYYDKDGWNQWVFNDTGNEDLIAYYKGKIGYICEYAENEEEPAVTAGEAYGYGKILIQEIDFLNKKGKADSGLIALREELAAVLDGLTKDADAEALGKATEMLDAAEGKINDSVKNNAMLQSALNELK